MRDVKKAPIESPCIKTCVIDPAARICTGCFRSIDEITEWSRLSPAARRRVMHDLPSRASLIAASADKGPPPRF